MKEENESHKENQDTLNKAIEEHITKTGRIKLADSYGITVKGENNLMIRFARCCNPVPGDEILGYITKGRGVSVHRTDCSNLKNLIKTDADKVVDVEWGIAKGNAYFAEIQVKSEDKMGILSEVMSIISDLKINLSALNANPAKDGVAFINIKIKITSIDELKNLMKKIKTLKGVMDVYRMNS